MRLYKIRACDLGAERQRAVFTFDIDLHKEDKLLGFTNEQQILYCFILGATGQRDARGELDEPGLDSRLRILNRVYKGFVVAEEGSAIGGFLPEQDIKLVQLLPPKWILFELIDLKELGKQGVQGFNFKYPGLLRDAGDLWKSIAKEEVKKNA